jgi:hypothetical protein
VTPKEYRSRCIRLFCKTISQWGSKAKPIPATAHSWRAIALEMIVFPRTDILDKTKTDILIVEIAHTIPELVLHCSELRGCLKDNKYHQNSYICFIGKHINHVDKSLKQELVIEVIQDIAKTNNWQGLICKHDFIKNLIIQYLLSKPNNEAIEFTKNILDKLDEKQREILIVDIVHQKPQLVISSLTLRKYLTINNRDRNSYGYFIDKYINSIDVDNSLKQELINELIDNQGK